MLQWNVKKKLQFSGSLPSAMGKALGKDLKFFFSLPSALPRHSAKYFFLKNSEILCRVPKQGHSAKKLFKKIKKTLPSAWAGALGKVI